MITTSMLKQQAWVDDYEFDYIVENSERVTGLNAQYENHQYVEEFTKQGNVMFIYETQILEGETDAKFFFGEYVELISGRSFTKQRKKFLQSNDKLCDGMELPTKNIRSSTGQGDHWAST